MFDDFFTRIETELGPLNPDWFEELTAKASKDGSENLAVIEDVASSHKHKCSFKAQVEELIPGSQMCSTPKVFRCLQQHSPDSVTGEFSGLQSPCPVLPGPESSPCLFGSTKDSKQCEKGWGSLKSNGCFDLLDTPKSLLPQESSARRICESLGAQLNPDLSWSSSFNTPSSLSPTVLLSKKEPLTSPVSFRRDTEVIFVRKLFPSLSKGPDSACLTAQHNDINLLFTVSYVNSQHNKQKSDSSSDSTGEDWRQTVPDAIKDNDVRNTVENVLDGAEDVLSIFFSNSGSALRRVKSKERTKRRVNGLTKEVKSNSVTVENTTEKDVSTTDRCTAAATKSPLFSNPPYNKSFTQWTPLSLSDVQEPKANQVCTSELSAKCNSLTSFNDDSTQRDEDCTVQQSPSCSYQRNTLSLDSQRSQVQGSLLNVSAALTFSKNPRKFVYRVKSSTSRRGKQNVTPAGSSRSVTDISNEKHYNEDMDAEGHFLQPADSLINQDNPATHNMDHDLDTTQLCKAFAEDFTQEACQKSEKSPNKSVSDCTTMEISDVRAKPDLEEFCKTGFDPQDFQSNCKETSAEDTNLINEQKMESTNCESLKHDSGYPADSSRESLLVSGSERLHSGFKTANNKPEAIIKTKAMLDESFELMTGTVGSTMSSCRPVLASTARDERPLEQETSDFISAGTISSSDTVSEKTPCPSVCKTTNCAFKTASNQSITVTSANLEKAEGMFKECEEENVSSRVSNTGKVTDQVQNAIKDVKSNLNGQDTSKYSTHNDADGNWTLTASQKADVSELCSLLEEASSQYEFTQCRNAKSSTKSQDGAQFEKDWDPDMLAGIDFDDSFHSDFGRQMSRKNQAKADSPVPHTRVLNSVSDGGVFIKDINVSDSQRNSLGTGNVKQCSDDASQNLSDGSGFKTTSDNVQSVSEKCSSKSRSPDLEDSEEVNTVDQKENPSVDYCGKSHTTAKEFHGELNSEVNENTSLPMKDGKQTCGEIRLDSKQEDWESNLLHRSTGSGFRTAGGKEVKISEKALQDANELLNEVTFSEEPSYSTNKVDPKPKAVSWSKPALQSPSDTVADVVHDSANAIKKHKSENRTEMKQTAYRTPRSVQGAEFKRTGGKRTTDFTGDVHKSKSLLKDIDGNLESFDETKLKQGNMKFYAESDPNQHACVNGFKLASGKGVSYSEKAFTKAKALFKDCDPDGSDICREKGDETSVMDDSGFQAVSGNMAHLSAIDRETLCFKKETPVWTETSQRKFSKTSAEPLEHTSGCGFSTASGTEVSVSSEALQRDKVMFEDSNAALACEKSLEISEKMIVQEKRVGSNVPEQACGFSTASGKSVAVSDKALKKARSLFTDCEVDGLAPDANLTAKRSGADLRIPRTFSTTCEKGDLEKSLMEDKSGNVVPGGSLGFSTAGGRKIALSDKALEKAKSLFVGCKVDDLTSDEGLAGNTDPQISNGAPFSTEGDQEAAVLAKSLNKMNNSLSEYSSDAQPCGTRVRVLEDEAVPKKQTTVSGGSLGFSTASGKKVAVSEKALKKARSIFTDCEVDGLAPDANLTTKRSGADLRIPRTCLPFSTTCEKGDLEKSLMEDKSGDMVPGGSLGFSTAGGRKMALSDKALEKAKSLFVGCEVDDLTPDPKISNGAPFSIEGDQEASVSDKSLNKMNNSTFGYSSDAQPCGTIVRVLEDEAVPKKQTTVSGGSFGFSTASGKKVAISEEALQNAKRRFIDCETDDLANNESLSVKKSFADRLKIPNETSLSFSTSSRKGVAVVEKSPHESLLSIPDDEKNSHGKDFPTENGSEPVNPKRFEEKHEDLVCRASKADQFGSGNFGFSTASGKGVSVSKSAIQAAFEMFRDCDRQDTNDQSQTTITSGCQSAKTTKQCTPFVPKTNTMNQTEATDSSLHVQATQNNPLIDCNPLKLDGCTVTQQKYFEQEAMACTKALLEDDLNEHGLLGTQKSAGSGNLVPQEQICPEGKTGQRKRTSDDRNVTAQPPLKRRLISEFDQFSDERRVCTPVNSSPNGTLRDRRVFKYNIQLKPNVTYPARDVQNQQTTYSDHQKRSSDPQKPSVFMPPFRKNVKPEMAKNNMPTNVDQTASVFVPPAKKEKSDHGRSSPQISTDSDSLLISSSSSGNKIEKGETAIKKEEKRDQTTVPCETKVTWQQSVELARDMQDMRLRKKKRQKIRPLPGTLYLAKTSGVARNSLGEAVQYRNPLQHTKEELYRFGVKSSVFRISSENAESFRFSCNDFFKPEQFTETGGVQLADGGWLIPDSEGSLGKDEFYKALCDTPGVDPKLINEAWVYNHYRWIVWKRASMERAFPETMGGRCLNPEQVLLQLKLRYDVEVDHSRRSALKKIMERDDTPAKTLVLCVCGVAKSHPSEESSEKPTDSTDTKAAAIVWLTDGWYSIKALLDLPLSTMLQRGRLEAGVKLIIHGAELIGSQDACPPLEAPDSLMLKISANSTRRARWDTKLGFYKDPRPFPLSLSTLYPNGGVVARVDIVALRSYPTQWMEKRPGGVFVFRNERAEEREAARHNSAKQKTMELLFSKIQVQFEKEEEVKEKNRRSKVFSRREIENLQDGEKLSEAMENDAAFVETSLSTQQVKAVSSYRRNLAEQRRSELQERLHKAVLEAEGDGAARVVTPVWKLAIADSNDLHGKCVYTLNIWRPTEELRSLLREGCRYKAYHLATSETKKRTGIANIQFTATKKTRFQDVEVRPEWLSLHFPARESTCLRDLQNPKFYSPCGEVDVVGYAITILDRQGTSPVLYLVDEKLDFVSVRICSSLTHLALEDLVKPLALLAVSNLQIRQLSGSIPGLYAGEQALFSTHPKETHLQQAVARLKIFAEGYEHFLIIAEEKLSNLIPTGVLNSCESPRTPALPKSNVKMNVTPQQARVLSPFTPVAKKTPTASANSESKDPRSGKRKRGLDYLSRLNSPAPLLSLGMVHSPRVSKTFNPPRRCGTTHSPSQTDSNPPSVDKQWVNDEELAMINTPTLLDG
ncbi:breast cancer type 2 susceptibility protein [Trichomycterus rosablanca]|uniref:breast cancer type 2 susceptibility protein n=1 Tax=Trichomycterus rosablanca TaxID=2290929 RepID=UPI002F359C27